MAKKKIDEEVDIGEDGIGIPEEKKKKEKKLSVEANIAKQFGDNVIVNAHYIFDKK